MNRIVFLIAVFCYPSSSATATTGWDRHDVQLDKFRIHGANGASFVHRIAATGAIVEPALCSNLDATRRYIGLGCPPDYAVTETHIAIRYPVAATEDSPPNHFLIRIEDGQVTGPMAAIDFNKLPIASSTNLDWHTPSTAADRFHRFVVVFATCGTLLLLGTIVAITRWIRSYRLRRNPQLRNALAAPDT